MSTLIDLAPVVTVIAGPFHPDPCGEIVSICHGSGGLQINLESVGATAEIVFPTTWGFRVLDELDLTEFWSRCSMQTGWLFEVTQGGWKALEMHRKHFVSGRLYDDLREFLVIGTTFCVSVLSSDGPRIRT